MTVSSQQANPPSNPLSNFYAEGERLGWTFRDRNLFRHRFLEPYPEPVPVDPRLVHAANTASSKMAGRIALSLGIGVAFASIFGCCAGSAGSFDLGTGATFATLAVVSLLAGAGIAGLVIVLAQNAKAAVKRAQEQNDAYLAHAIDVWHQRRDYHEYMERQKVDALAEWGTVDPPEGTRRVDVVGGTTWGWEALLTVFGGSLLRTRGSLTLVDFTGEAACRELVRLADETGVSYDVKLLPQQLAQTDLLAGLNARQIVDTIIESVYGDVPTGSRADRAQDDRILTAVCRALGDQNLTMARIAAALRVLMGEPGAHEALTPQEREHIADNLFADEFKRQVHPNLRRMEAYVHPLEELGTRVSGSDSAALTCLVDESDGRSARRELLKDLTIQWLTRRVSAHNLHTSSLVIVGADEVSHLHLERLTELCERRKIRLVLFFRHLRDAAVQAIGGGAVCFMRLPNHEEARQAAEFIGRHHKFALSQITRTLGGNETHSIANTEGQSRSEGGSWSWEGGRSSSWGITRNWSQTVTQADGSNWSDAAAAQRVYEYAVEPRTLQDLPDYALLLVKGQGAGSILQPVECNPAIITLPRATMAPLPAIQLPDAAIAEIPVAGSPIELQIAQAPRLGAMGPSPESAAHGVLPGWGTTGQIPPQQQR